MNQARLATQVWRRCCHCCLPLSTKGDKILDTPLSKIGGKGLFVKELEAALQDGSADLAVHSCKDVPMTLPAGFALAAILPREDARDALIGRMAKSVADLPKGATVGTASLRRQAMLLRQRPDLKIVPLRGNVETRLKKIGEGQADATLLALAGLKRLGLTKHAAAVLSIDEFLPAVGQGAIGIETRADDENTRTMLAAINHPATAVALAAERAFLAVLDGSCRTPIAGHAVLQADGSLHLRGLIAKPDGSQAIATERRGPTSEAAAMGKDAGLELKKRGGPGFLA